MPSKPKRAALGLGLACVSAALGVASVGAATSPAARYVLTTGDLGLAYTRNDSVSGRRTLGDASIGDSALVRKELKENWLAGSVAAFNSVSGSRGVVSIVDVFRPGAPVRHILRVWQKDAQQITHGTFETVPARAPGDDPVLIRGTIVNYEVLLYMWSRGTKIASIEVTGKPGEPKRALLLQLVRRQNVKLAGG